MNEKMNEKLVSALIVAVMVFLLILGQNYANKIDSIDNIKTDNSSSYDNNIREDYNNQYNNYTENTNSYQENQIVQDFTAPTEQLTENNAYNATETYVTTKSNSILDNYNNKNETTTTFDILQ